MMKKTDNITEYEQRGYLDSDFKYFHISDKVTSDIDFHYHDFYKIILILKGNVRYLIEGREYELLPFDFVLVNRFDIHKPVVESKDDYDRIILYLKPEFLEKLGLLDAFMKAKELESYFVRFNSGTSAHIYDMLLKAECEIAENDNFEVIHDRLGALGADLLQKTIDGLEKGEITPIPQDHSKATHTAKILKEDCEIDFTKDCDTVHNLIRGLSPIPLAFTHTPDGKLLKIVASEICERNSQNAEAGKVISLENGKIRVACATGSINILTVLPEGKGRMTAGDFVRGRKIQVGDILN
jgi:quercetin dioxygenase-like cupin family protein